MARPSGTVHRAATPMIVKPTLDRPEWPQMRVAQPTIALEMPPFQMGYYLVVAWAGSQSWRTYSQLTTFSTRSSGV